MTFPPGAHLGRTNFARITAQERDAIVAALRENPDDLPAIAARFQRSENTINRIRQRASLLRRVGTKEATG